MRIIGAVGIVLATWSICASARAQSTPIVDTCFKRHAARFGLDPGLLRSIAVVESGMRAEAENASHLTRTGTSDIGIMQINSGWLPTLARYGIGRDDLREPCTNIEVGAWILSGLVSRLGDSWDAVGAYNAACSELKGADCRRARARYAWKVWRQQQPVSLPTSNTESRDGELRPASTSATTLPVGLIAASGLVPSNPRGGRMSATDTALAAPEVDRP